MFLEIFMGMKCYTNKKSKGWKKAANPFYIKPPMQMLSHVIIDKIKMKQLFPLRWKIWLDYTPLMCIHRQLNDYAKRLLINYLMSTCSKGVINSDQSQNSKIKATLFNIFILISVRALERLCWWQVGSNT